MSARMQPPPEAHAESVVDADPQAWRQLLRVLIGFTWNLRPRMAALFSLTMLRAAALAASVYYLHASVAALVSVGEGHSLADALRPIGMLFVCQMADAVCQYLGEESQRWLLDGIEIASLRWVLKHIAYLPADYFRDQSLAKFVVQLEKLQFVVRGLFNGAMTVVTRGGAALGVVAGILPNSPTFALVGVAVVSSLTYTLWQRSLRMRNSVKEEFRVDVAFIDRVLGIFSNLRDIRNFRWQAEAVRQFSQSCQDLAARSLQVVKIHNMTGVWLNVLGLSSFVLLVGAQWWLIADLPTVVTCFASLCMLLPLFTEIVRALTTVQTRMARLEEWLENLQQLAARHQQQSRQALPQPIESIRLEDISLKCDKSTIINRVSVELRAGEVVGLIGRSGAGKTTLAQLLLRLIEPTEGRVLVNGVDLASVDEDSYWRHVTYVPQTPCRIGGTVAEEVRLARSDATEPELESALSAAGIPAAAALRPLDDEHWNDTGAELAWHTRGLQQRAEWARVLLRGAEIVVLDEPTSLTDPASERQFSQLLRERRAGRFTLIISHRPETLAACDRLLILKRGSIVGDGPRDAMLERWLPESQFETRRAS